MSDPTADGAPDPASALEMLATIAADVRPDLLLVAQAAQGDTLEVAAAQATENLAKELGRIVRNYVELFTNCAPTPYGPASEISEGHVMWLPASQVPMLSAAGVDSEAADLPMLDLSSQLARRLKLSAIRAPTATGRAVFYRALNRTSAIGYAGKLPILRRGDRFDVITERTVVLDRQVDAVVVNGIVLFDNRKLFQRVFGLLDELRQKAGQTFDVVTAGLRIKNLDQLREAATGQLQMLGKMSSIARKLEEFPAYKQAMTMEKLLAFIEVNPHTSVAVEGEGDEATLVFEPDAKHRFKILKLLDDDYLQSGLTDLSYEANSKGQPLT